MIAGKDGEPRKEKGAADRFFAEAKIRDGDRKDMTLDKLPVGKSAVIDSVDGEASLRKHILDMGLTPNTEVTLVKTAPMGDPLELSVRGYELTLRKEDAARIGISDVREPSAPAGKGEVKPRRVTPHPRRGEGRKAGGIIPEGAPLRFALAGNQNCGKTTLFNQLTGSNQHVGNFPGVTVDRKDGVIRKHREATVTDLPGIYSLSPYTGEEIVTREFLLKEKPDGIINIVDATNIERNLYLTLQLMTLEIPMVIALNMMDEVRAGGGTIDINALEAALGIPVVPVSAAKNEGIEELIEHAVHVARYREVPYDIDFCPSEGEDGGAVHRCIHAVAHLIEDHAKAVGVPPRFAATKLIEGDELVQGALGLTENEKETKDHIIKQMEEESGTDALAALADARFRYITGLCAEAVVKPRESRERRRSERWDRILTGKYTAFPAFILIVGLVFYLTFGLIGKFLSDQMEAGIGWLTGKAAEGLTAYGINPVVKSLIVDGIFAGVGSVLSFLPTIVVLFFFLSILEDTGYMARVAFVMDKPLRKIGLSGRSFVPMLVGFGCSVPAIMATRTLPSDRDRKMTILLTPFMSCSAKIPVYGMLCAAFFSGGAAFVMIGLYLIGVLMALLVALVLKKTAFRGEPVPFVMELPNYRLPSARSVLQLIWEKARDFITRAFTIIFVASVVIWFLQSFDSRLNFVTDSSESILAAIGGWLSVLFRPLGFGDWRAATALVTGFTAKESVKSTLTVLLGGASVTTLFSPLSAFVFLLFILLYTPCVAAIAAVRRELGRGWAAGMVVGQCFIAYLVCLIVALIGGIFV